VLPTKVDKNDVHILYSINFLCVCPTIFNILKVNDCQNLMLCVHFFTCRMQYAVIAFHHLAAYLALYGNTPALCHRLPQLTAASLLPFLTSSLCCRVCIVAAPITCIWQHRTRLEAHHQVVL